MTTPRKPTSCVSPQWPRHALAHACLLALAGISPLAHAQAQPGAALTITNATLTPTQTTGAILSEEYNLTAGSSQFGAGMTDASNAGIDTGSTLIGAGTVPTTVSNNVLQSTAMGNQSSTTGGLGLLANTGTADGLLAANLQSLSGVSDGTTIDALSVSATVGNSNTFINQTGMASADLTLSGNTLTAGTQLNQANTRASGVTPVGYVSTAVSNSRVAFDSAGATIGTVPDPLNPMFPTTFDQTAGVNLSNLQSTFNASPTGTVSDSGVALDVSGTTGGAFANAAAVNDNTLSASTGNNTATSIFQAEATSAAWNGSVSVTNLQNSAAAAAATSDALASVTDSTISADLRNGTTQTNLTGSLTLNDNQISASSTGNSAGARTASGAISAGNAITFDGGADITGSGSGSGTSVSTNLGEAYSQADLNLLSAQANDASTFTTSVSNAGVTSNTDNVDGGTLTQSGNAITARSSANLAGNLVSAGQGGSVSNFSASVAALNVQSNTALDSTSSVEDTAVSAAVGIAAAVADGAVTLSTNTLAATAEGNVGVTTVALKAANFSDAATPSIEGLSLEPNNDTSIANLGVVALSVQTNETAGTLTASNEGTGVSLSFSDQAVAPVAIDIDTMNATLSSNQLRATATANTASTGVVLAGTNGTGLTSAVGNNQRNNDLDVLANAGSLTPLAVSLTAGAVDGSALALTSNTLSAAATGNTAFSSLNVSMTNASGSTLVLAEPQASVINNTATSRADMALANVQQNNSADLTAALSGGVSIGVAAVGSASTLDLSSNLMGATVDVNRTSNTMALAVNNASGLAAGVSSGQNITASTATASTAGGVALQAGAVEGSALTANSNTLTATTMGNVATNSLSQTGTTATGVGTAVTAVVAETLATGVRTIADVALGNMQSSSGDTLSALTGDLVNAATVGMTLGAVSGDATLSLANNKLGASTSVNSASNGLDLNITNVTDMTASTASFQSLVGTSADAVNNGLVSIEAASLTDTSATLRANAVTASVLGNSANNALSLTATTAAGRDVATSTGSGLVSSAARGDFVLQNSQQVDGSVTAVTLSATTDGTVTVGTGGVGNVTGSALTLSGNSVSAYTGANNASNQLALSVTDLSAASAGIASSQVIDTATVTSTNTGNVLLDVANVSGSALTLNDNALRSTSLGNMVNNQLSLAGTNATGSAAVISSAAAATTAVASGATAQADVALTSLQSGQDVTLEATTTGTVGMALGAVSASSALTLSGNTIGAVAQNNSASNTLGLSSTNLDGMSAAVASSQLTSGSVTATAAAPLTGGVFSIAADSANATPVVLSNNTLSAVAGMNEAFNTLRTDGATVLGRGGVPTTVVDTGTSVVSSAGVDFSVINAQSGTGNVSALADPGTVGYTGSLTGGSLSIDDNTVQARASVNTASNLLTLSALNSLQATAAVNNLQDMDSAVSAVAVDLGGAPSLLGANLTAGGSSTVTVNNNNVTAQATGNLAGNVLNAVGVSGLTSSGSAALPTLAVLNRQNTQATGSVEAVLNGTNLGAALNGTGGSTSVQGNQMVAMAYGNSVDNTIAMRALPTGLNTASAAITNVQYNMASITAAVSGASMAASGSVSGAGVINVSGNSIVAQAVANRAVNTIAMR